VRVELLLEGSGLVLLGCSLFDVTRCDACLVRFLLRCLCDLL